MAACGLASLLTSLLTNSQTHLLVCLLACLLTCQQVCAAAGCNCTHGWMFKSELVCELARPFDGADATCLNSEIAPKLRETNATCLHLKCSQSGAGVAMRLGNGSFDSSAVADVELLWIDTENCEEFSLQPDSAPFRRMRSLRRLIQNSYSGQYSYTAYNFLGVESLIKFHVYFSPGLRVATDFLTNLPNLQFLSLSGGNYPSSFFHSMTNASAWASVQTLALQKNHITTWPKMLQFTVNLRNLHMDDNMVYWAGNRLRSGWLPRLQFLSLGYSDRGKKAMQQRGCRFFSNLRHLQKLKLRDYKVEADCSWFGDRSSLLSLECDHCHLVNPNSDVFKGLVNLRRLHLLDTRYHCADFSNVGRAMPWSSVKRRWSNDWSGLEDFFSALTNLTELQLNKSRLTQPDPLLSQRQALPPGFFGRSLRRLRLLSLQACGIEVLRDSDFQHLTSLTHLDMSWNRVLTPQFLLPLLENSLTSVRVEIECGCDSRQLKRASQHLPDADIRCRNLPVKLRHFSTSWLVCDNGWLILMLCVTAGALTLASSVSAAVYRYRFDLQYWCLTRRNRSRLGRRLYKRAPGTQTSKQFTAFVSYNHKNSDFVYDELVPQLENDPDWQIRLCIDDRDFLAGSFIIENVWQAVDLSRFTIFLVDKAFVSSNWCQYELRTAEHLFLEKLQSKVVLIFLEGSESLPDLPGVIRRLKKFVTYLTYSEQMSTRAKDLFWKRLKLALAKEDQ